MGFFLPLSNNPPCYSERSAESLFTPNRPRLGASAINTNNPATSRTSRSFPSATQSGFILLPVVMTLTLIAAIAYLINREGAMTVTDLGGEMQSTQAVLAAKAGINHMLWQANNANCTGYSNLAATTLGANSYSATISPNANSPVVIKATGTDAEGAAYTITRERVPVYQPYKTVTLQLGVDSGKDALIASANTTANFGATDNGVLKGWLFIWLYRNQLIQFDLNNVIPASAKIVSAQLQLYQKSGGGSGEISLHRIKQSWVEGTKTGSGTADGATWKTYDGTNAWIANGGDFDATPVSTSPVSSGSGITMNFEIGSLVQDWLAGKYANNGVLLKSDDMVSPTFAAKEDTTASRRPKLIITYACECGKVCTAAKKVYWTDDVANKIQRSDEDGSNVEDVLTALDRPTGIDFDTVNKKLYWTNNTKIRRANLDGSNIETVYSNSDVKLDIKLDVAGGKMYWTKDLASGVFRANLDGSSPLAINITLNRPSYLSLDTNAGYLYTTNFGNGVISRMNLDGANVTSPVSGQVAPVGNAVDPVNGKLYWSSGAGGTWIRRSNLDGSTIETLVTGLNAPQDIFVDADNKRIYWTEAVTTMRVQRANVDGTNVQAIATGLARPRGIALIDGSLAGKGKSLTLNAIADTYLDEGATGTNYGSGTTVWSGLSLLNKRYKGLIKFDVSSIPAGAIIKSARLVLNQTNTSIGILTYNIGLYKIKASWSEASATWTNFGASANYDTIQQAATPVTLGTTGIIEWALPVTLINEWKAGTPTPNYGVAMVVESAVIGSYFQYASKENATAALRPQLAINYTLP
jgi:Domain of unknown function (DUF5050)